ncbi:alpha tubulin suppressor [Malassezia brasiliensis]|uniref:Alpha tubulin suppressor n=1 Tax=Malassezia brasiliensis TaxID=1821822 RepID=A0AAF0DYR8_9BASI|nr:alpha tubulin suppressor [Malassezia brasiliensis]
MRLDALGSNADGQLGVGHTDDVAQLAPCCTRAGPMPPPGWRVEAVVSSSTSALLHCTAGEAHALYASGTLCAHWDPAHAPHTVWTAVPSAPLCAAAGVRVRLVVAHVAAAWDCFYVVVRRDDTDVLLALGVHNGFAQLGVLGNAPSGWVHRVALAHGAPLWPSAGVFPAAPVRVAALAAGVRHAMAYVVAGARAALVGWGDARHGQLGAPPPAHRVGRVRRAVRAPTVLYTWAGGVPDVALALGMQHSVVCVEPAQATLWLLGSDRQGQLDVARVLGAARAHGPPDAACVAVGRAVQVACNWHTTLVYDGATHRVLGVGDDRHGQCGEAWCVGAGARLGAGSEHAVVCGADGVVRAFGWNEHGNVGAAGAGAVLCADALGAWCGLATTWVLRA